MNKVLLIEDDIALKENLGFILNKNNFSLITAEDGKTGIELAGNSKPDAVVCDIMLPDIDGFQIIESIKNNEANKNIPFLFISAKSAAADLKKGMELGADDYLVKPFKTHKLINSLNTVFEKKSRLNHPLPKCSDNLTGTMNYNDEIMRQLYKSGLPLDINYNPENFAFNNFLSSRNVNRDYEQFIHRGIIIVRVNLNWADLKESLNFQKYLLEIMQHNLNRILVDLSLTAFMDSAFTGVLINIGRKLKFVNSGELRVVINHRNSSTNPILLERLEKNIKTYEDLNIAINCFGAQDKLREVQAGNLESTLI